MDGASGPAERLEMRSLGVLWRNAVAQSLRSGGARRCRAGRAGREADRGGMEGLGVIPPRLGSRCKLPLSASKELATTTHVRIQRGKKARLGSRAEMRAEGGGGGGGGWFAPP